MALETVRALVFDVFGTVVDWRGGVAREAAPFLERHGAANTDPLSFADAWRESIETEFAGFSVRVIFPGAPDCQASGEINASLMMTASRPVQDS